MMGVSFWLAQSFSIVATIIIVISFQIKNKNILLLTNVAANVFMFVSLMLLGAYLGAASTMVGVLRGFLFFKKETKPKWYSYAVLYYIFALVIFSVVLTFTDYFSIIMLGALLVLTFGLWQQNKIFIRLASIFASAIFIAYNLSYQSYGIVALESLIIISCVVFLVRVLREHHLKKKEKNLSLFKT